MTGGALDLVVQGRRDTWVRRRGSTDLAPAPWITGSALALDEQGRRLVLVQRAGSRHVTLPDGSRAEIGVLIGSDGRVFLGDVDTEQETWIAEFSDEQVCAAAFSPDGGTVAVVGIERRWREDERVRLSLLDEDGTRSVLWESKGGGWMEADVAWSPTGDRVAVSWLDDVDGQHVPGVGELEEEWTHVAVVDATDGRELHRGVAYALCGGNGSSWGRDGLRVVDELATWDDDVAVAARAATFPSEVHAVDGDFVVAWTRDGRRVRRLDDVLVVDRAPGVEDAVVVAELPEDAKVVLVARW